MNIEQRKALVQKILMKGKKAAADQIEIIKANPDPDYDFLFEHLRLYVLAKYMLDPDVEGTNIKELATLSLAVMMKLDRDAVHSLDQATPCDHATSESAKKVLLLFAVQKDLELKPNPEKLAKVETLEALADYVLHADKL